MRAVVWRFLLRNDILFSMRIDLGQLSAADLHLDIPADQPDTPARDVSVSNAEGLRGVFVTTAEGFQLSNVSALRLLLAKLHWKFGGLSLVTEEDAALLELKADVGSTQAGTDIDLELGQLDAERLHVATASLHLAAQVEAHGLALESREGVGLLTAKHAVFHAFELQMGALTVGFPELRVTELVVDWGGDDFRLEAGTAEASAITLTRDGVKLEGSGVSVAALRLLGAQLRVGQLRTGQLELTGELAAPAISERTEPGTKAALSFDYELLNGLAGRLDVDVAVDIAVPIIGHRKATHELRVPIDRGALNYRELEHNLARLEDSLIDFSVLDGALVLERGLPLIATRGRGKPILIWDLNAEDLALAEQQRVRLAVLPKFRLAGASGQSEPPPPKEESGSGGLKLRHLSFENIDAALRLLASPSAASGVLRDLTFTNLTVRGTVHHDPEGPARSGSLDLLLEGLRASLGELVLGEQSLKGRLEIAALRDAHVEFNDLQPTKLRAKLEGLALADLELV